MPSGEDLRRKANRISLDRCPVRNARHCFQFHQACSKFLQRINVLLAVVGLFLRNRAVTARWLLIFTVLPLFANGAYGRGTYQRASDGKTLVWNDHPASGYEATWTGDRDSNGYAIGQGTLTWFRVERPVVTGSNIPSDRRGRSAVVAQYSGKMVRGQLDGPVVRVDADGRTFHGVFVNGNRASDWAARPAAKIARGGTYQRTDDGKTLVWNEHPGLDYEASWSGDRDSDGYGSGEGTLTWYRFDRTIVTGSNIPSDRRGRTIVVSRYSGKMIHGKLGVKGNRATDLAVGPTPTATPHQRRNEQVQENVVEAPAPPAPTPRYRRAELVEEGEKVEAPAAEAPTHGAIAGPTAAETPTHGGDSMVALFKPPSSLRSPVAKTASAQVSAPSASPPALDSAEKNRVIAEFKNETQSVLSRVSDSTGNFHEIDRLDSVQKLPAPVSESVVSLADRARDFRSKIGDEAALEEYRTETATANALAVVDQTTRNIVGNDASKASSGVGDFLKSNPEPSADSQKPLWRYLTSVRALCSRLEKEADVHLQRAQSLASAGKISEAIREYQEAYRIFPNPVTAEKIRQLQNKSVGL